MKALLYVQNHIAYFCKHQALNLRESENIVVRIETRDLPCVLPANQICGLLCGLLFSYFSCLPFLHRCCLYNWNNIFALLNSRRFTTRVFRVVNLRNRVPRTCRFFAVALSNSITLHRDRNFPYAGIIPLRQCTQRETNCFSQTKDSRCRPRTRTESRSRYR